METLAVNQEVEMIPGLAVPVSDIPGSNTLKVDAKFHISTDEKAPYLAPSQDEFGDCMKIRAKFYEEVSANHKLQVVFGDYNNSQSFIAYRRDRKPDGKLGVWRSAQIGREVFMVIADHMVVHAAAIAKMLLANPVVEKELKALEKSSARVKELAKNKPVREKVKEQAKSILASVNVQSIETSRAEVEQMLRDLNIVG